MGIFLALTRTSDPTRPTRRGPDPNRTMYGNEEWGYELSGIVRGGWRDRAVATATWYSGTHSPSKAVTNFSNRRRPHRNSKSMGAT